MSKAKFLRQIFAMGGGGFSMEPDNPILDDYLLSLCKRRKPRVCFIPTASGDSPDYIEKFHAAFKGKRADASHLPLFRREETDLGAFLLKQDIIYVGGGNTANMLAVWRVHGVDRILRSAWRRGVVLAGVSAGMICWFEGGLTDSFGPLAALPDGLGLLPGTACPHYDGEINRRPAYQGFVSKGFPAGLAADDGAAFHFIGRRLTRCVSSRRSAKTFKVQLLKGKVVETRCRLGFLARAKVIHERQAQAPMDSRTYQPARKACRFSCRSLEPSCRVWLRIHWGNHPLRSDLLGSGGEGCGSWL